MTVSTITSKITYAGNGSTTVWDFPFPGVAASDIFVFITNTNGTVTLAPPSTYTITLNAPIDPNPTGIGGSVTYSVQSVLPLPPSPLPVGTSITIARVLPRVQPVSLSNQSIIYPPVVEQEFDYLTMLNQQLSEMIDRAVKVGIADAPLAPLPPLASRISQPAIFDAMGNLTAGGIPGSGVIISPVMIPVVGAPSLAVARNTMGVPPIDSPTFTGDPKAPTPNPGDNDTSIATTAYVQAALAGIGSVFPAGTEMLFHQTAAPTGWVKSVTHNDKALRVVNTTISSGGVRAFSTTFNRTDTDAHTLIINEIPVHGHGLTDPGHAHAGRTVDDYKVKGPESEAGPGSGSARYEEAGPGGGSGVIIDPVGTGISIAFNGGGAPHSHPMDMRVMYVDVIIAVKS